MANTTFDGADLHDKLRPLTAHVNQRDLLTLAVRFSSTYKHLAKTSTDHFLPTPVVTLPTGKEKGLFLAIDVGGTNLRVGFIELLGEATVHDSHDGSLRMRRSHEKVWPIGEHLKFDQAEDLFLWIGDCIAEVISDYMDDAARRDASIPQVPDEVALGITFSFPMSQDTLSEATLLPMGKGFAITSNLNLGKMLLAGYSRHCESPVSTAASAEGADREGPSSKRRKVRVLPRIRIAAITNDTVATLASSAYLVKSEPNSRVAMGLIVGTGTNATIPMKLMDLHKAKITAIRLPKDKDPNDTTIVINTEWTIRGTDVPMKELGFDTEWDRTLDKYCEAPGFQPFEYMTAGRYLGEIVRLATVDLLTTSDKTVLPSALLTKNALTTTFLATVVAKPDEASALLTKLEQLFPPTDTSWKWTPESVEVLRQVALAVQKRASALIAAAIVGLLACVGEIELDQLEHRNGFTNNTKEKPSSSEQKPSVDLEANGSDKSPEELVVAYTGSTISYYPSFLEDCQHWIDELVSTGSKKNNNRRVVLREARDGGIIGAAVLAGTTLSNS